MHLMSKQIANVLLVESDSRRFLIVSEQDSRANPGRLTSPSLLLRRNKTLAEPRPLEQAGGLTTADLYLRPATIVKILKLKLASS